MAEPAGLALGVVALAGLFDSCIQSFRHVVAGVKYGEDCEILLAKLAAEKLSLQQWGDRVGILESIEARRHPRLSDPTAGETINEVLACVCVVLKNSKKLEEKYGLRTELVGEDDKEKQVQAVTRQNSRMASGKLRDRISRRRKTTNLIRVSRCVLIDHEKFEKLVSLLEYFTKKLNDFCPNELKLVEHGENEKLGRPETLDPKPSVLVQVSVEEEPGSPTKLAVEETTGYAAIVDEVSATPVQSNAEAEIAEEPKVVVATISDPGNESSTNSAARLEHRKKSSNWSVNDIVNWRSNISGDFLIPYSISEASANVIRPDGLDIAHPPKLEVLKDVRELMKSANYYQQIWSTMEGIRAELDRWRELNHRARLYQETYKHPDMNKTNSDHSMAFHELAVLAPQQPLCESNRRETISSELAPHDVNGRNSCSAEQLISFNEIGETSNTLGSSMTAHAGNIYAIVEGVDGKNTPHPSLHDEEAQTHADSDSNTKPQQSTPITDPQQDRPLDDRFEKLFEQYSAQVVQNTESSSSSNNGLEDDIEDYCKKAIEDLGSERFKRDVPAAASIVSEVQERVTKVMGMLRKVKGLRKELKTSTLHPERKVQAAGADEDASKSRKVWLENDGRSNWLSQRLSEDVEDVLQKKLKRRETAKL